MIHVGVVGNGECLSVFWLNGHGHSPFFTPYALTVQATALFTLWGAGKFIHKIIKKVKFSKAEIFFYIGFFIAMGAWFNTLYFMNVTFQYEYGFIQPDDYFNQEMKRILNPHYEGYYYLLHDKCHFNSLDYGETFIIPRLTEK